MVSMVNVTSCLIGYWNNNTSLKFVPHLFNFLDYNQLFLSVVFNIMKKHKAGNEF